jgi:SAM-dependent methyltransferase
MTTDAITAVASASGTAIHRCYLCGDGRVELRFAGRSASRRRDPSTYACTNLGHGSHPPIWRCTACGMLSQWPTPSGAELLASYRAVEDPVYEAEKDNRYFTFRRVVRRLGPGGGQRLLDVGAYCGYFLDVAREHGYQPEGMELSRWAAERARALGFPVHSDTLTDLAERHARYDVVTMWDVIEHMGDPRAELEAVFTLLAPGGRLYLSTIDAGSLTARLLGSRWPWLMDMHLHYFTHQTVTALLREAGFDVRRIDEYTHVVSSRYLLQKAAASIPRAAPGLRAVAGVVPSRWRIPVNLGDNMLVSAVRPG